MEYLLILVLNLDSKFALNVKHIEFQSQQACESAGEKIIGVCKDRGCRQNYRYVCVSKN